MRFWSSLPPSLSLNVDDDDDDPPLLTLQPFVMISQCIGCCGMRDAAIASSLGRKNQHESDESHNFISRPSVRRVIPTLLSSLPLFLPPVDYSFTHSLSLPSLSLFLPFIPLAPMRLLVFSQLINGTFPLSLKPSNVQSSDLVLFIKG